MVESAAPAELLLSIASFKRHVAAYLFYVAGLTKLSMGWVDPRVELDWAGLGWVEIFSFFGGLGRGSETVSKILKLSRPFVTAEVIPDNPIMINADK